jgi:glucokinase
MILLGIDLGGTKLAASLFDQYGLSLFNKVVQLESRRGTQVGQLVNDLIGVCLDQAYQSGHKIDSIGISIPGISYRDTGTVWAPNISGWDNYPLLSEVRKITGDIPTIIDNDRSCSILGEAWMGKAKGCKDAVFIAVGTGIGAGILVNGEVLRGHNDIAGAIGWMALSRPFKNKYKGLGCFEYYASGEGISRLTRDLLLKYNDYSGSLSKIDIKYITSYEVFAAFEESDPIASEVIELCIEFWGMAVANIVSLFNPEIVILGGGVFGPAQKFRNAIKAEAEKWAQPVSIKQTRLEISELGGNAALFGAGYLGLMELKNNLPQIM